MRLSGTYCFCMASSSVIKGFGETVPDLLQDIKFRLVTMINVNVKTDKFFKMILFGFVD